MRIAFISLFRKGLGGGEGRVAHELADHFNLDHDVVMICPARETGLYEREDGLEMFGIQSVMEGDEFELPALSGSVVHEMFEFLDLFDPHIVHAHEAASIGLIGQVWARMNQVPFVHTTHVLPRNPFEFGAVDALNVRIMRSSFSESVLQRALGDFYDNCDAIIALNRSVMEALRQFGYEGRIFIIPNGRDLAQYAKCVPADMDAAERILTFVGYLTDRKNQAYLIRMASHLPQNYRLQLIGDALDPEYGHGLRDLCERMGCDNVIFTGQIPHEEIPQHLEKTHIFVSASKMEAQSLVIIEALASGTPVVGLSNETIDELVDEGVGHRLPKDTEPEVFARYVEEVCSLPQTAYDRMCAEARRRVTDLDWSNVVDATVQAYNVLLEEEAPETEEDERSSLDSLVSFLPDGEVREILVERLDAREEQREARGGFRPRRTLRAKWRALRRVPHSTWVFAGLTILLSLIIRVVVRSAASLSRLVKPSRSG
ncbi:MAG: glycosyltransferase [Anaerolineales bacterium]